MAYRKKTYRKKTFKKKRIFKARRKSFRKKSKYDQHFNVKAEIRAPIRGKAFGTGSAGARMAVYWGSTPNAGVINYGPEAILYPFNSYEWTFWHTKFEEYQIAGVKISA